MNHYYSEAQDALEAIDNVSLNSGDFKHYSLDDKKTMNDLIDLTIEMNDPLIALLMIKYCVRVLKLPMFQTKNWLQFTRLYGDWIKNRVIVGYVGSADEATEEFRAIEDAADCMAFKLKWL